MVRRCAILAELSGKVWAGGKISRMVTGRVVEREKEGVILFYPSSRRIPLDMIIWEDSVVLERGGLKDGARSSMSIEV